MKEVFYGATGTGNRRIVGQIFIIQTKIGNRYVVYGNKEHTHYIPLECLECFCEQFPETALLSEKEIAQQKANWEALIQQMKNSGSPEN